MFSIIKTIAIAGLLVTSGAENPEICKKYNEYDLKVDECVHRLVSQPNLAAFNKKGRKKFYEHESLSYLFSCLTEEDIWTVVNEQRQREVIEQAESDKISRLNMAPDVKLYLDNQKSMRDDEAQARRELTNKAIGNTWITVNPSFTRSHFNK